MRLFPVSGNAISKKQFLGIDILRFLAACLVVAFHYCFLMGTVPNNSVARASRGIVKFPELYEFTNFGWIGVEIFFVISGFVIAFSGEKSTAFSFLRSRIVRLGPAVWICAPITLMATILVRSSPNEIMYRAFRHSMAFLPWGPWIDGSYWTLGIEVCFYAAVLILIKYSRFENIKILAIVVGVISFLFSTLRFLNNFDGTHILAFQLPWLLETRFARLLLVHHGMFFALGVFLWSELIKKHDIRNLFWIFLFCVAGCMQIIAETNAGNSSWHVNYSALIPCLIWLLSITLIVASVLYNSRLYSLPPSVISAIRTSGSMTYPLYLVHQIVGAAIMGWMVAHGINRWIALGTCTLLILILAWKIATQAEPWLQTRTNNLINWLHERYSSLRIRFVK